ncbi:MAG: helix-turn-helix transcriptional regulator [Campylobacterales bacterium]|nr:helix-turn-helix transcriptional regulator [Campylobacterales bacterium]
MELNYSTLDNLLKDVKSTIRNERIALDLTQKEFADIVSIKYATYRSFEQTGKLSLENYLSILIKLNKHHEFQKFLEGFEFENQKQRARTESKTQNNILIKPIIAPNQKQIVLDKNIFGNELFYSVDNGHIYEVSTFISIILKNYDDEKLMLLIKYFGMKRLKPYILKQKDIQLLEKFNKHLSYIEKGNKC